MINIFKYLQVTIMELFLILKIIFIIGVVIALYAVARNLDIIKIILNLLERFNS